MKNEEKHVGADAAEGDKGMATSADLSATARHTPGPWRIDREEFNDGDRKQIPLVSHGVGREGYGIADVRHWSGHEENWANAHLIAAAPELYEALKDVLASGLNGGNNVRLAFMAASRDALDDKALAQAERSEQAVTKAYAAIAKAEGRNK